MVIKVELPDGKVTRPISRTNCFYITVIGVDIIVILVDSIINPYL